MDKSMIALTAKELRQQQEKQRIKLKEEEYKDTLININNALRKAATDDIWEHRIVLNINEKGEMSFIKNKYRDELGYRVEVFELDNSDSYDIKKYRIFISW